MVFVRASTLEETNQIEASSGRSVEVGHPVWLQTTKMIIYHDLSAAIIIDPCSSMEL